MEILVGNGGASSGVYEILNKELVGTRTKKNKFDPNNDASNRCENERIFLNLLEFV